jgi:hypothetical protein
MYVSPKDVDDIRKSLRPGGTGPPLTAFVKKLVDDLDGYARARTNIGSDEIESLAQTYDAITQVDRGRYNNGLSLFLSKFPQVALALRSLKSVETVEYFGQVSQTYNGGAPLPWKVPLTLTLSSREPGVLLVRVNIRLVDGGGGVNAEDKSAWETQIKHAWSDKFRFHGVVNGAAKSWTVRFSIDWVGEETSPARRYDVSVAPAAATNGVLTPQQLNMARTLIGGQAERLTMARAMDSTTQSLGVWGAGDKSAVVHEFGHAIGCPDEYDLAAFAGGAYGIP